mgnify:CR=1 FL=1
MGALRTFKGSDAAARHLCRSAVKALAATAIMIISGSMERADCRFSDLNCYVMLGAFDVMKSAMKCVDAC